MHVKDCEKCEYCIRKVWSQVHMPKNYHAIGMSHAYHFCLKFNQRILSIKKCKEIVPKDKKD